MNRLPVLWSKDGRNDIEALIDHIAEATGSVAIASRYADRIESRCEKIGFVPRGGALRDDLKPGLRTISFERSALICYVILEDAVWITNVFRRGRNIEAFFKQSEE